MGLCIRTPPKIQTTEIPDWKELTRYDSVWTKLPAVDLCGKKLFARVVKVYDGDTVTLKFCLAGVWHAQRIRLMGINTPELLGGTEQQTAEGCRSRDILANMIGNKVVFAIFHKNDKYGRPLVNIYYSPSQSRLEYSEKLPQDYIDVNRYMLRLGGAVPYLKKYD